MNPDSSQTNDIEYALHSMAPHAQSERRSSLKELAFLFLRLGATAFGGPAAHIAIMEDEVVNRRKWLTRDEFLDLLGATNLIPGPNSTEMAIHIGHRRAGWRGLLVAGLCFILPATFIVLIVAWGYVRFGNLPQVDGLLYGIKPVILAIVFQAVWRLGRSALKTRLLMVAAVAAGVLNFVHVNELIVLFGTGIVMAVFHLVTSKRLVGDMRHLPSFLAGIPFLLATGTAHVSAAAIPFSLLKMFFFFVKVGSILFGSGYVLLAFLRADLVDRWHWLTTEQLLDAIAVGQITPGPVFTTATFVGYLLGGMPGAVLATAGIFLPAFIFVALSGPLVARLRQSPVAGAFLDGVNAASLALLAVVMIPLVKAALIDWLTVAIGAGGAILLFRYQMNSTWLIIGSAAVGILAGIIKF